MLRDDTIEFEIVSIDDVALSEIRISTVGIVQTSIVEPVTNGQDEKLSMFSVTIPQKCTSLRNCYGTSGCR